MDNVLVLVRHGESEWNKLNLFTGWKDPDLSDKGVAEAHKAGQLLKAQALRFDIAFTSDLKRAQRTLDIMLDELGQTGLKTLVDRRLNERDYGQLAGLNKDEARKKWGEKQVQIWRRSFDVPPPGGESLQDTAARVLPYYKAQIWPEVAAGRNVLVAAHGNSLRALIMQLEGLSGEQIVARELRTGVPIVYRLDAAGAVSDWRELAA
ncbi:MAG TPA: 2,3-bisphosphoglycerate-dependent phosphoglycerate mutase [Hyphomicrobiaceae bacterium]|jgi:2,3-bisphosphoglycerate-dependent phosphoglycerate mutase|nr:2,3-bisphosphoglycerate-dependent phosphoglycerate mutase [Hyphomicrobiaceae bacterium]